MSSDEWNKTMDQWYYPLDTSSEYRESMTIDSLVENKKYPLFSDISVSYPLDTVPFLDQEIDHESLTEHQQQWAKNGFVILKGFIPDDLCDDYLQLRENLDLGRENFPTWDPYNQHEIIKKLFLSRELHYLLVDLVGEELGLHFNLSFLRSTERGWHQDDYLNPPSSYGRYLAIWLAVGNVHPESGPFEFVPGSHRLPCVSRKKVCEYLKEEFRFGNCNGSDWAKYASRFVNPAYKHLIETSNLKTNQFIAEKGDILIWHSKLIHRGAPPINRDIPRYGIIGHYSSIRSARWFGDKIRRYGNGGYYWDFG